MSKINDAKKNVIFSSNEQVSLVTEKLVQNLVKNLLLVPHLTLKRVHIQLHIDLNCIFIE